MTGPRASTAVDCHVCGKTISRKTDLGRHLKTHSTNKAELMHTCPYYPECTYKTLQRSNLRTHLNVHSRERPNKCPEGGCAFATSDPGSLTRHRKELHGYRPKQHSGVHRRVSQRRRVSPYSSSSCSGSACSVSPSDPPSSSSSPSPSLSIADGHVEGGIKNSSAGYNTQLIIQRALATYESQLAPNPYPEDVPHLNSGLWIAPEVPMAEHPQLSVPEQEGLYVVCAADQSTPELTVFDDVLDNFLAQFNDDWLPVSSFLSTPTVPYDGNNALAPVPLPPYAIDEAPPPLPASLFPYAVAPCDHSSYTTDAFWSSGIPPSHPDPFATLYPQVVDQDYFYTACNAETRTPGLYVH
ncbi:hypothetical protein HD554DRAFT_1549045 [Boletus coccyginus]|nr:hypothetical protein HD554DRAFT_1549045 [Boletus coccyginus]